jgi:hypothetical protein
MAMDGNLMQQLYTIVPTLGHPERLCNTHSDSTVALILLRAAADKLSVLEALKVSQWTGLPHPATWPSQATMSRRARTESVQALLTTLSDHLRRLEAAATPASAEPPTLAIDGRALDVGPHTSDPEATYGYGTGRMEKGYKLHTIWGSGCLPLTWIVMPMNAAECTTAKTLLTALPPQTGTAYLLGDSGYDINYLYALAAARGWQLLAPQKNPGRGYGHRRHEPARLRGLELLKTPAGQALYRKRTGIERHFGHYATRAEGLNELPKHVRRLQRVRLHVHITLILNACRILNNKQLLPQPTP